MNPFLAWMTLSRLGAGVAFMAWAASLPWVLQEWGLTGAEAGLVQTAFNLAYAVSLLGSAWAADRLGAARISANWLAAAAFLLCALFARSLGSALTLFSLLALMLGGGYAPSLMLAAAASTVRDRGAAVGWTLAGASIGYFLVIALAPALIPRWGLTTGWLGLCLAPFLAAICGSLAARAMPPPPDPPQNASPAPDARLSAVFFSRDSLLLTGGYAFHCWELLGLWAWAPAFLTLTLSAHGLAPVATGLLAAGALHLTGAVSTLLGGAASDRFGRRLVLVVLALAGEACSFTFGWLGDAGAAVLVAAAALYGFAALGDSGVLSAAMADAVPAPLLGRILALRSICGFGAGALAPLAFGAVLDLTNPGSAPPQTWGWAFALLGLGGLGAALCAWRIPDPGRLKRRRS